MRKSLSFLLVLTLLCPLFLLPTTASANANLGYFPVNYSYTITHDDAGAAHLNVKMYNNTYKAITRIEVTAYPRDIYGNTLYYYGDGDPYYCGVAEASDLNMYNRYDAAEGIWVLYGFDAASYNTLLRIDRVFFADGTFWRNEQSSYYEEANFEVLNPVAGYHSYEIDATRNVKLRETGYSVHHRDWYIWDNTYGWMWFSDEFEPTCTVWEQTAKIMLVINNNPNLRKIVEFRVTQQPEFLAKYRADDKVLNSSGYENEFYSNADAALPYYIDLWDVNDTDALRSWYIWNDTYGWLLFSHDRGPACELWSAGAHRIALVYNNDWNTSEVFYFNMY